MSATAPSASPRRRSPPMPRYQAAPALRCRPDARRARACRAAAGRGARGRSCSPAAACHLSGAAAELGALARALNLPVAHTMTGKGAIACTDPLSAGPVRPLRPHRQRADRRGRPAAGRRLQARRDRDQALHPAAQRQARHPSRHRRRGVRPHRSSPSWRCGATRARRCAACRRPWPRTRQRSTHARAVYAASVADRMAAWRDRRRGASTRRTRCR